MTRTDWLVLARHVLALALVAVGAYMLGTRAAPAHSFYEYMCCSDRDCRPIPFESVKITTEGYIVPSGELVPFNSRKIRPTPAEDAEQRFHWCTVGGTETGHTLCLYVPQGGV